MAKKEVRVYFNLENENEKRLYEHLMNRTSAGGYLKDIALDVLDGRYSQSQSTTNISIGDNISEVVAELKNINKTLSNLEISTTSIETATSKEFNNENVITEIDVNKLDVDAIDFDDIPF